MMPFSPEQIKNHRQQRSIHTLNALEQLLKEMLTKTLPGSPLGDAISYTLRRWEKLCVYASNAILQKDNNLVEKTIRQVALGYVK